MHECMHVVGMDSSRSISWGKTYSILFLCECILREEMLFQLVSKDSGERFATSQAQLVFFSGSSVWTPLLKSSISNICFCCYLCSRISGVYTSNLLNDLKFYLGQILSLCEAKSLGKYLTQIFSFIKGQYLAQIKFKIVKQIGCVDAA